MANVSKQSSGSEGSNQFSHITSEISHRASDLKKDIVHMKDDFKTQLQSWVPEQPNISEVERTVSGVVGSALGALAVERFFHARYLTGSLALIGGSALLLRGISGKCPAYKAMGRDTSAESEDNKAQAKSKKASESSESLDAPMSNRTGAKSSQVQSSISKPDQNRSI